VSVRDCLEFTPGLEVGDLVFVGRCRAREAAWCCQVMACGRGKSRGREAICWVFGTTEARSRGWHSIMFELVQPNRGFRDHACSKQRPFTPQLLDLKQIISPATVLTILHLLFTSQSDSWVCLRTPRRPRRTTPSSPLVSRPDNPSTARRT
jgi:hypothetical protein